MADRTVFRSALFAFACLVLASAFAGVSAAADWPQFRGPGGSGVAAQSEFPEQWSASENVLWKTDVPGRGWSSPIVVGERVFITSAIEATESEPPKKGLYLGGNREEPPAAEHQWKILCFNLADGTLIWERQVHQGQPPEARHLKNSFASETPATDGERIYCYFGQIGVFCLDFEGNIVWKHTIAPKKVRHGWGTASSPVIDDQRVYIQNDNDEESYLLALDKRTGREVWQTARDEKSNWSTPFVWKNGLRTEIVTAGTDRVRSYDTAVKLLWSLRGMSSITIATPYAANDLVYITSGFVADQKRPIYAIRPGASGDISLKGGETKNEFIVWAQPQAAPYNPTTLVYRDRLYVLYDRGLFSCYNALTGAQLYGPERLPDGRAFTASPWAAGERIYCLNEDGVTFVLAAGDRFELVRTNPLGEEEMALATPAIADDRLLIRTAGRLYCIGNSRQ